MHGQYLLPPEAGDTLVFKVMLWRWRTKNTIAVHVFDLDSVSIKIVMIDASLGKVSRDVQCDPYSRPWCTCHVMNRRYRISGWKYCEIMVVSKHAVDRPAPIDRNLRSRGLADMMFAGTDMIASCSPILLRSNMVVGQQRWGLHSV
jgi:hypothetical protein